MPDDFRIKCINPACRRTASFAKVQCDEIVCSKCWKLIPIELRQRYRQLNKRDDKINRILRKRSAKLAPQPMAQLGRMAQLANHARRRNWMAIKAIFTFTDRPPVGIEEFMREAGLR